MKARPAIALGVELALKDMRFEWLMAFCHVAALTAILIPLLVLDSLRTGIVSGLTDNLRSQPAKLRLHLPETLQLGEATVDRIARLDGIGYIEPTQRDIAVRLILQTESGEIAQVDLLPSRAGDPLLGRDHAPPTVGEVLISRDLADRLGLDHGAALIGRAARTGELAARFDHPVTVAGILPEDWLSGSQALAHPQLIDWLEAFRDGYALPHAGIEGRDAGTRPVLFENLRLYASSIEEVPELAGVLRREFGFQVRAAENEIADINALERGLALVFWIIGAFALAGLLLSLASSLWADVERKRRALGVLCLLGTKRATRLAFPVTQALIVAFAGFAIALAGTSMITTVINHHFASIAAGSGSICELRPSRLAAALLIVLVTAVLASLLAGWRVTSLTPTDGMRDS